MFTLASLLLVVALVLFLVAAFGVPTGRVSVAWLGMAFVAASRLVG